MKKLFWLFLAVLLTALLTGCRWSKDKGEWGLNNWKWELNNSEKSLNGWAWMTYSSYYVKTFSRNFSIPWEDIYVYDENNNLVLSLDDKEQPQRFYVLFENYLVLDSWTGVNGREVLVYDVKSGDKIFQTDYDLRNNGLIRDFNVVSFYKKVDDSLLSGYVLPQCDSERYNGYVERYEYVIWETQANALWDIQCAYFE